MTDVQAQLTRDLAIENNTDPLGNKWGVAHKKQTALYYIGKIVRDDFDPTKEFAATPLAYPTAGMSGHFTKVELAEAEIRSYLNQAWDANDEKVKKAAGKERAKKAREEEKALADNDGQTQTD